MSIYPVIAAQIGFDDAQAGFVIGASVHDVAQAIGGGYSFSDSAGQNATIVKLSRVAMLAPVVVLVSLWVGQEAGAPRRPLRDVVEVSPAAAPALPPEEGPGRPSRLPRTP